MDLGDIAGKAHADSLPSVNLDTAAYLVQVLQDFTGQRSIRRAPGPDLMHPAHGPGAPSRRPAARAACGRGPKERELYYSRQQ